MGSSIIISSIIGFLDIASSRICVQFIHKFESSFCGDTDIENRVNRVNRVKTYRPGDNRTAS